MNNTADARAVGTSTAICRASKASSAAATSHNWITTRLATRTSTAENRVEPCWYVSTSHLDTRRHQIAAALFDDDSRQAPRGRSREREPVARGERSLVARTRQRLLLGPVHDRAREVRADLRECVESPRRVAHEDAWIVRGRISEQQ